MTVDPNLDQCNNEGRKFLSSDPVNAHTLGSDVNVATYHATDEEHAAARAKVIAFDKALGLDTRTAMAPPEVKELRHHSSDVNVATFHATDEEHAASRAKVIEFDKALGLDPGTAMTQPEAKELLHHSSDVNVSKRSDDTDCFNKCFGVNRVDAVDAANWFCNKYNGFTVDSLPDDFEGDLGKAPYSYTDTL